MKIEIISKDGKKTGKSVTLSQDIFGIEPNDHSIYLAVRQYQANIRRGTSKAKERNEIAGSTKKIKRQKGTGTARAGDIKNPIFRGGGRIFGPKPRDYSFKLNKKIKELARKSALTYKAKDESILIIDKMEFDNPKTKQYAEIMKSVGINNDRHLLVTDKKDDNLRLSARNIASAKITRANDLNVYDILNAKKIIFEEGALKQLEELFAGEVKTEKKTKEKNSGKNTTTKTKSKAKAKK